MWNMDSSFLSLPSEKVLYLTIIMGLNFLLAYAYMFSEDK